VEREEESDVGAISSDFGRVKQDEDAVSVSEIIT